MSLIINIANAYPSLSPTRETTPTSQRHVGATFTTGGDTIELSRVGEALSLAAEMSSFSIARVRAIRAEIEGGTFETPERIAGTVKRLLDVFA